MPNYNKPLVLCILDGWAYGDGGPHDAVSQAETPHFKRLEADNPHTTLKTSGLDVGLPDGQMGNSEVGHMNIGAGRVVMQFLPRIDQAFAADTIRENKALKSLIETLRETGGTCHVMGLFSDGGVHSHKDHMTGVADILRASGIDVALHLFTDGRDTAPESGRAFVETLSDDNREAVKTVSGRYYAMDRDKRWERIERAYRAIVQGKGPEAEMPDQAIAASYEDGTTDEFIVPTVIGNYQGMKDGDAVLFINFRADRAREILTSILDPDFTEFERPSLSLSRAVGMVEYSDDLAPLMSTLFPPENYRNILGEVLSKAGLRQLRMAETEKYPHVTFFFNGGNETPFDGEDRLMVPSPKVPTYDLQPEMAAPELTGKLCAAIESDAYDVIVVNYANPDMVGHSGDLNATVKAVEAVDDALGNLIPLIERKNGILIVTSDHGNADRLQNPDTGEPHTAHTTNPVPFIVKGADAVQGLKPGILADIAPTILSLLGIDKPEDMTGQDLRS